MHRSLTAILPLLMALTGCVSNMPPGAAQPTLDAYRVGTIEEKASIDDWDGTFVQADGSTSFTIVDGDDSGSTVTYTVKTTGDGEWELSTTDRSTWYWSKGDDGMVCTKNIDVPSGSTSTFDPPLLVLPKSMEPGTPVTAKGSITVVHTDNPSSQMASGTWTTSISHDGDVTLKLGDDEVECTRIHTQYDADLGLATVDRESWDYYAKGRGWVATVFKETVTKVIIPEHTTGTWILSK